MLWSTSYYAVTTLIHINNNIRNGNTLNINSNNSIDNPINIDYMWNGNILNNNNSNNAIDNTIGVTNWSIKMTRSTLKR